MGYRSVLYRSCTGSHRGKLGSIDDLDREFLPLDSDVKWIILNIYHYVPNYNVYLDYKLIYQWSLYLGTVAASEKEKTEPLNMCRN